MGQEKVWEKNPTFPAFLPLLGGTGAEARVPGTASVFPVGTKGKRTLHVRTVERKSRTASWPDFSLVNCLPWDNQMAHLLLTP